VAKRSVVIGTAGHIDHGKTTLVRALTGVDTDRLPEEKRRGITIELGFAAWAISDEVVASIVDVPGHENFVRTMVAGAGGIDAVVLVVSAEDGVMPQTREHLNVCRLLGVSHGVVALTKVDRLEGDEEAIELAVDDVRESLQGSVFADAIIVPCSGQTGFGLDRLRKVILDLIRTLPRRATDGGVILPLDRVFTMKGHGTVVTGTLLSGIIDTRRDLSLRLEPAGDDRQPRPIRVRGVQVRHEGEPRVLAGSRIALNLGGVDVDDLRRGDVLADGDLVGRTTVVHAQLHHLPGRRAPWKHGSTVQVCAGTAFSIGHLDPLWRTPHPEDDPSARGGDVIVEPGREGLVRVRLDNALPVWRGQTIVLRDFSGPAVAASSEDQGRTMGGGTIVDPAPSVGRGQRQRWIALGRALAGDDLDARLRALVEDAGRFGIELPEILRRAGVADAPRRLEALASGKRPEIVAIGARFGHVATLSPLADQVIAAVDRFHAANPMQPGLPRAALEGSLGDRVHPGVASWAVERAIARGALQPVDDAGTLARPGKGVAADGELPEHMQRVLDHYAAQGITAPTVKEVTAAVGLDARKALEIIGVLQRTGRLVKVTPDLSFDKDSHERLLHDVRAQLREHGHIDVQVLKQLTGLSRKYVVPFLEHLDQLQITVRDGDTRRPGPRS
jgi:selenocysteine-specific elongation factor